VAATNPAGAEVGDRLAYLFKRAHLNLAALHEQLLAPFGISAGELAVMMLIQTRAPESQQQIADRLGIDRTTMVEVIDGLETKGLVNRRPDTADRRRKVVELTEPGRSMIPRAIKASDQAEQQLLAGFDDDERATLLAFLRRIATNPH
jgi:DNA-binding MarR family transcriptional regulator